METSTDKRKVRSPSFPFIDLREAAARARALYEAERRNPARPEVAAAHWGYSAKSSGAMQTIAALRSYGMLEGEGMLRLTDRAVHILLDNGSSPERAGLLREAALAPPVHARLWERYAADLPSDKSLASFLVLELGFNQGSVDLCLRNYRETLAFAGLTAPKGAAAEPPPSPAPLSPTPGIETPAAAAADLTLRFPLLHGNQVELRVLRKIPSREAEQLRRLFDLWLEKITEP
jgi:hypothetical protein